MGCNKNCGLLTGTIIGAALAILGGILIPVGNNLIEDTVEKEAVIEKGTTAYENWVVPGSPIYRQFWLFDVQNPEEVMMNGSNPILKQKGPYTYRMRYKPKENITEHDDATLSYHLENIVLFQPELSNGLESDNITTVNFAVVTAPVLYPSLSQILNMLIQRSKSKLLQTRTVKEILWGYTDPFLELISFPNIDKVVGIFHPYNETFDGPYRINSGKDDIKKVGIIQSYKNNRSFSATFDREKTVKGIPLYHFVIPPSTFASPVNNPDNICFCTESEISQNCTLNGILDLGPCKEGRPVYITLPHFLHASSKLFQFVDGLKPDEEEHKTFLDVEPTTGFTLHYAKRLQINMLVRQNSKITVLQNIKHHFIFPVLWMNETAIISDEKAELFRSKVTDKIKLLNISQIVLISLGSVMFLGFLIAVCACKKTSPK
ncbi:platelet glycoprotein 4-like isoform X2 [Pantherophis guttatus]|uniref:Platelet glycoprotein 4 n=1 Tax=Pantherophis guttatus TaxID=94885 RepID=A0A6P9DD97_PANGU|nr:platelet glycoprotein 4-like isoform X2 [Pantherophis guttatus]